MSQNDFNIANQGFPSFRSDLNDALQALASNSSGATEPATTYAGQFWYDSTNDVLKFRNEANSAWIDPPIAGLVQALSDLGVTASAAELNKMDGVTASTAEINYIDGVTSNIQTQLNAKGVGDITGVTAGTNLTGGGASGSVTVNLTASPNITSLSVGSSEVISSARQLKNIASVDATTVAALGAAGVGGGGGPFSGWNPASTPNATLTGSGTWTKPSDQDDGTWVVFYMVGGGCGGQKSYGSATINGGSAQIVYGTIGALPSSLTYSVGAGGSASSGGASSANNGGNTTLTGNGRTFTAYGGEDSSGGNPVQTPEPRPFGANQFESGTQVIGGDYVNGIRGGKCVNQNNQNGTSGTADNYLSNAWFGGGGGGNASGQGVNSFPGGVSLYAGNGGTGSYTGNAASPTAPGGGGGSVYFNAGNATSGAAGNIRVYYISA